MRRRGVTSAPPRPTALARPTLALHGGERPHETGAPVVTPLYQGVSHLQEIGTGDGMIYPRYGNARNATVVQERMAALDGAEAAIALASGMGATACALLALLRPGDHLLASTWIYGGTRRLLMEEFTGFGIDVTLVDPIETRVWRKHLR
nr:PLP-dependent transferase [Gemmatimonadaceae bacterium]